ncbi:endonuclease Q family protein [Alkalihalobacillus sp. MEB130]|uniref:endonuclease Q family protein n=1 Tax=Alkalihalobacillus sp. MEB130 TaxID=2976704 RepID=UPI0028E04F2A|nr:endonuclease Q family protein [Alkalihalobacillus sp. MEB130]MDT8859840.1 endonuclease Q family protein [Alkalihalobacillus sp. MEB130]
MIDLQQFVVDLHIHIGRTRLGAAVKITAAPSLTLQSIIHYAVNIKGIDLIGVIDCHVKEVLNELEEKIETGEAFPLKDGGVQFPGVTLLLGTEIELLDDQCKGPIHVLVFMPTIETMKEFSEWLATRMTNPNLSSQRIYEKAHTVQLKVRELDGLFIPAHIFTPFKSLYGKGVVSSLKEVFDPNMIDAVELGLSSDTSMADQVHELHAYPFLTNSDAHSLEKMAREYQIMKMKHPSFQELKRALQRSDGREISSNYGLNPLLGKYYRTICAVCSKQLDQHRCTACQSEKVVKGVFERLQELASNQERKNERPPYVHQVPLEFIPKLGKQTLKKLRNQFGTDMNIIHSVSREELRNVVSSSIVEAIMAARNGTLSIKAGGGGVYGKISTEVKE